MRRVICLLFAAVLFAAPAVATDHKTATIIIEQYGVGQGYTVIIYPNFDPSGSQEIPLRMTAATLLEARALIYNWITQTQVIWATQ